MMKTVLALLILCFSVNLCSASSYQVVTSPPGPTVGSYANWRNYAWQLDHLTLHACAHLATYETQTDFNAIVTAVTAELASNTHTIIYLGAQKGPGSNTFYWSVGSRRGQPFFTANLITESEFNNTVFLIDFESGFTCHQEFCFSREYLEYSTLVYGGESEAVILQIYQNGNYRVYEDGELDAPYGVVEYETIPMIANPDGGSAFVISSSSSNWVDANDNTNLQGTYIARIQSQAQQNWIMDELQCPNFASTSLWLGFKNDPLGSDTIYKGPGPSEGQVLFQNGACIKDLFCNFASGTKKRAPTFSELPGFTPSKGLALDANTGNWGLDDETNDYYYLYQAEYCSASAFQFFKFKDLDTNDHYRVCTPNPSNDWLQTINRVDADTAYFTKRSFYAGAGHYFYNGAQTKSKLLYFDCDCNTNPIIDKSCLGSDFFPGYCQLYTNNFEYYAAYYYFDRLKNGINYSFQMLYDYEYWSILINFLI